MPAKGLLALNGFPAESIDTVTRYRAGIAHFLPVRLTE
jgi:hypothetical protein